MRKFIVGLIAALLLGCVTALAVLAGWITWQYEYGIGLTSRTKLATLSATDQLCSAGKRRTFVPLAEIPPLVRNAFLSSEEPDFYQRWPIGSPFVELAMGFILNRRPRPATISMHLTRCLMPQQCCRGLDRSIGTLFVLHRVESALPKDLIFEIYLNDVYLGRGASGVADAAARYFGKSPTDLSPGEIAFIVTRARAPYSSQSYSDVKRRNLVLERMLQNGAINEAEAASAREQPLTLREWPDPQAKPASTEGNQSPQ